MTKKYQLEAYPGSSDYAKGMIDGTHDRAMWLHYLLQTAEKLGYDVEALTDEAIFENGRKSTAAWKVQNAGEFAEHMVKGPGKEVFHASIKEAAPEHAVVQFRYCPLVAAWLAEGLDGARVQELCRHACKGDFGRASNFPITLRFAKQLAKGDDCCELDITTDK